MRRVCLPALFCLLCAIIAAAQQPPRPEVIVRAGSLLDTKTGQVLHNQDIVIRGNLIEAVRPSGTAPAGAQVIDLSRATVLPGLIDSHTHIYLQGEDPRKLSYDDQLLKSPLSLRAVRASIAARRALEQGFTTIRDVETEGAGYGDIGIKEAIEQGFIPGPRMFVVTRAISTTGGYPLEGYAPEIEQSIPKGAQLIDGPIEARKAAREQLDNGADWIKVYMTHRSWERNGKLFSQPTLTVEELEAITSEAHAWGRKVACHAYGGEGLRRALVGGCDSIEHGLDLTDDNIAFMKQHGVWYVPTLSVYYYDNAPANTPDGRRDLLRVNDHEASFKKALAAGLKIAYGTDDGGFDWADSEAQEFARMVGFGMNPLQAIQSATVMPAQLLEQEGKIGVIAPGAFADIIAVAADPLKDVNSLEHVAFVMKDGKVFKNELH